MRLETVLRAAVLSVTAMHCDEDVAPADASSSDVAVDDATVPDVRDAGFTFVTDANFEWYEAGPPQFVDACGACCKIMSVPCPIPPGDYIGDSSALYFCDRYCGSDTGSWGCDVIDAGV